MLLRSSWLEGKVPFTLVLLPLFWITLLLSPNLNQWTALWVLGITHVFLYGSVNVYVNFYDSTKRQHGDWTLRKTVAKYWLYVGFVLHIAAIALALLYVNVTFSVLVFLYGTSAYVFALTRNWFKSPSYSTWSFIRAIQGIGGGLLYYFGLNNFSVTQLDSKILLVGVVASLILAALFPATGSSTEKKNMVVFVNVSILIVAAVLSLWLVDTVISSQYTAGIITAFTFGIVIVLDQLKKNDQRAGKGVTLSYWIASIGLNAYAFYLFTDYTQVFQLLY